MKGYRKIAEGDVEGSPDGCEEENRWLDDQIRGSVHSPIIEEMQKSGCSDYRIVVYKKIRCRRKEHDPE